MLENSYIVEVNKDSKSLTLYESQIPILKINEFYYSGIMCALKTKNISYFMNLREQFDNIVKDFNSKDNTLDLYFDKYIENDYVFSLHIHICYDLTNKNKRVIEISFELYDDNDSLIFGVVEKYKITNYTFSTKFLRELHDSL